MHAALLLVLCSLPTDDWPQWRGPHRDGTWREDGIVATLPEGQLPIVWRADVGAGYAGPTVADGRVFVMSRFTEPDEVEQVACFEAKTGELLWEHVYEASYAGISYPAGPRCSVLVDDGRAYSLGATGKLFCLEAESGEVLWSHDLVEDYEVDMPIWGIAASPIVEKDLLIVPASGADNACLVAFDRKTGKERWHALDDRGNYSAPIVIDQAGERVLVYYSGDRLVGVDPMSGTVHWEVAFPSGQRPLGVAAPVLAGDKLFFTGFYDGCTLLRVDPEKLAVEQLWTRKGQNEIKTDGLHSTISTPVILGEHVYGVDSYGQLRCLRLSDGERVWEDLTAVPEARWSNIHLIQHGEHTWMLNERGELILATLDPNGFHELARAKLIEPTEGQLAQRGGVVWSHPAFADRHVFARNDREVVCADLSAK